MGRMNRKDSKSGISSLKYAHYAIKCAKKVLFIGENFAGLKKYHYFCSRNLRND